MATRSNIAIRNDDGTYDQVYVHRDGYPSYMMPMLTNNYNTRDRARELINLGSLSIINARVKPDDNEDHDWDHSLRDVTLAHHRDRGSELHIEKNLAEPEYDNDYLYKFDDQWYWFDDGIGEWKTTY